MPVLIILLYYVNDLSKLKRYYDQTEFVAQQFVNIIQNISQKRKSKAITQKDIMRAASLAYLTLYPGKTMYRIGTSGSPHELSHAPRINIFYVKGLTGGKASCSWNAVFVGESAYKPIGWGVHLNKDYGDTVHSVRFITDATEPSSIYKNLKINEGEEKVIVEVNLFNASHVMNTNEYVASDKQETLAKKAFKCLLAAPNPLVKNVNNTQGWYFDSVVVFTPKSGLFDPDNPPAVGT